MNPVQALCIAFLRLDPAASALPTHVETLLLERVGAAIRAQRPDLEVRFDDARCPHRGTYAFGLDSLVLQADAPTWRGRAQIAVSDLLEGRRIDYGPYLEQHATDYPRAVVPVPAAESSHWRRPLLAAVIGGAVGAGAGALFSPNAPSRPLNALTFGLGGALVGSFLFIRF